MLLHLRHNLEQAPRPKEHKSQATRETKIKPQTNRQHEHILLQRGKKRTLPKNRPERRKKFMEKDWRKQVPIKGNDSKGMNERERVNFWSDKLGQYALGSKERLLCLTILNCLENPATRNSYLGTMEAARHWIKRREEIVEPPLEENAHICIEGCHAAKIDRKWVSFANAMYSIIP